VPHAMPIPTFLVWSPKYWSGIQIMKFLFTQIHSSSCNFLSNRHKCLPWHLISDTELLFFNKTGRIKSKEKHLSLMLKLFIWRTWQSLFLEIKCVLANELLKPWTFKWV
jgi:hypothetical protein